MMRPMASEVPPTRAKPDVEEHEATGSESAPGGSCPKRVNHAITEPPAVPPHLRPLEEKQAAIEEFWENHPVGEWDPDDDSMQLLWDEREALKHIYPNSLVDLGRQGIIKMRVFREDGSSYFLPSEEVANS